MQIYDLLFIDKWPQSSINIKVSINICQKHIDFSWRWSPWASSDWGTEEAQQLRLADGLLGELLGWEPVFYRSEKDQVASGDST